MATTAFPDIGLKPTILRAAARRAKKQGKTAAEYLRSLVERDVEIPDTFDDVLKPFREAFAKSGKSEEQLDEAINGLVRTSILHRSGRHVGESHRSAARCI